MNALFCICVSGFTQSRGTYHGILRLREELIADGFNNGTAHRVWYLPWVANWQQVARDMQAVCTQHGLRPKVVLTGYSYGGWGALQMARELEPLGIEVTVLVLCDPVGRPWYWPRPLPAATSMCSRYVAFQLKVPPNVRQLHSYYQVKNRPQGHRLACVPPTVASNPIELRYTHDRMDDAPEYRGRVMKEARAVRAAWCK
jgi:pimeloyl-ACP methyl ester carboxylesterase